MDDHGQIVLGLTRSERDHSRPVPQYAFMLWCLGAGTNYVIVEGADVAYLAAEGRGVFTRF